MNVRAWLDSLQMHLAECERGVDGDAAQDRHGQRAKMLSRGLPEIERLISAVERAKEVLR